MSSNLRLKGQDAVSMRLVNNATKSVWLSSSTRQRIAHSQSNDAGLSRYCGGVKLHDTDELDLI